MAVIKKSFWTRLVVNLIFLMQCYMVFFQLFSDITRLFILLGLWGILLGFGFSRFGLKITLIKAIIYSIPTSFVNIMGTDYGSLPISYFNIFSFMLLLLIILEWIIKNKIIVRKIYLPILLIILIICSIIPTAYSPDLINATKQFLNVILFCTVIIIALVVVLPPRTFITLIEDYLQAASVTCIGLITQSLLYKFTGITYGKLEIMGGMRTAYGFLFSDYSFLSLYLSSAALLTITLILYNRKLNLTPILCCVLLVYGSILTTARTGMVALICALVFYGIIMFVRRPIITLSIIIAVVLIAGFYLEVSYHQRQDILSSSGRLDGYHIGLEQLKQNPLLGTGFGVQAYKERYGIAIPHNIVIQYLVQGGLLVGLLVAFLLIIFIFIVFKNAHVFFLPVSTIIIGAQFIPDIFNSRFFPVMLMISLLSINHSNHREGNIVENCSSSIVKQ